MKNSGGNAQLITESLSNLPEIAETAVDHAAGETLVALAQAQSWLAKRAEYLPEPEREFIAQSIAREKKAQARARRVRLLVYVMLWRISRFDKSAL